MATIYVPRVGGSTLILTTPPVTKDSTARFRLGKGQDAACRFCLQDISTLEQTTLYVRDGSTTLTMRDGMNTLTMRDGSTTLTTR